MEDLLKHFEGKRVDINCGSGAAFRGKVVKVNDDIVQLQDDDDRLFYINCKKVIAVSEASDASIRPGFIA